MSRKCDAGITNWSGNGVIVNGWNNNAMITNCGKLKFLCWPCCWQPEIEIESINGTDVGQSRLCFPAHFGPVKVRVTVF